jgi:hypothetical protein
VGVPGNRVGFVGERHARFQRFHAPLQVLADRGDRAERGPFQHLRANGAGDCVEVGEGPALASLERAEALAVGDRAPIPVGRVAQLAHHVEALERIRVQVRDQAARDAGELMVGVQGLDQRPEPVAVVRPHALGQEDHDLAAGVAGGRHPGEPVVERGRIDGQDGRAEVAKGLDGPVAGSGVDRDQLGRAAPVLAAEGGEQLGEVGAGVLDREHQRGQPARGLCPELEGRALVQKARLARARARRRQPSPRFACASSRS